MVRVVCEIDECMKIWAGLRDEGKQREHWQWFEQSTKQLCGRFVMGALSQTDLILFVNYLCLSGKVERMAGHDRDISRDGGALSRDESATTSGSILAPNEHNFTDRFRSTEVSQVGRDNSGAAWTRGSVAKRVQSSEDVDPDAKRPKRSYDCRETCLDQTDSPSTNVGGITIKQEIAETDFESAAQENHYTAARETNSDSREHDPSPHISQATVSAENLTDISRSSDRAQDILNQPTNSDARLESGSALGADTEGSVRPTGILLCTPTLDADNEDSPRTTANEYEEEVPTQESHDSAGSESEDEIPDPESDNDSGSDLLVGSVEDGDDDGEDDGNCDGEWSHVVETREDLEFAERVGVDPECANHSVVELFKLFFNEAVMRHIVDETNRNEERSRRVRGSTRKSDWPAGGITVDHLEVFLGLTIAMGLANKGSISNYWSSFWLTNLPGFGHTMPRQLYRDILTYLHFADDDKAVTDKNDPGFDKLWQIRPVMDMITGNFREHVTPGRNLLVGESMIKFKGTVSFKLCDRSNETKWGIKVFTLSEATSGYLLNVNPNSANSTYTSPSLYRELEERGILGCGAVQMNKRGLPADMKETSPAVTSLKRGQMVSWQKRGMTAVVWRDSGNVAVLATVPVCANWKSVRRSVTEGGERRGKTYNQPDVIAEYSKQMASRRTQPYKRHIKQKDWFSQVFWYLLDTAVFNAHALHKKAHPDAGKTALAFREELSDQLIRGRSFCQHPKRPWSPPVPPDVRLDREKEHAPISAGSSGECKVHLQRRGTSYICKVCRVRMCVDPCFHRYHYMQDYKFDDPAKKKVKKQ